MKCFVVAIKEWKKGGRERGEKPRLLFAYHDVGILPFSRQRNVIGFSENLRAGKRFEKAEEAIKFARQVQYVWGCKARIYNAFIPRLKPQPTVDLGVSAVEPDEAELRGELT